MTGMIDLDLPDHDALAQDVGKETWISNKDCSFQEK